MAALKRNFDAKRAFHKTKVRKGDAGFFLLEKRLQGWEAAHSEELYC